MTGAEDDVWTGVVGVAVLGFSGGASATVVLSVVECFGSAVAVAAVVAVELVSGPVGWLSGSMCFPDCSASGCASTPSAVDISNTPR